MYDEMKTNKEDLMVVAKVLQSGPMTPKTQICIQHVKCFYLSFQCA
jgi:hypothetical protein